MEDLKWEATKKNFRDDMQLKNVSPLLTKKNVMVPIFKYEVKAIAETHLRNEVEITQLQKSLRQ